MERCGKVTASRIADILAKTKSGPSASRQNYLAQLVAERLTMTVEPSFTNAAMQWGTDHEPIARAVFEIATSLTVNEGGFINHPTIDMAGASPDGLISDDGLLELKCPNTATHIDYLLKGEVPPKYKPQMAWQIICTERKWCYFGSFDPRMPDSLQLFVVKYEPTMEYLNEVTAEVVSFIAEVDETVRKLEAIQQKAINK
jgi:putative phage-type endonuclease